MTDDPHPYRDIAVILAVALFVAGSLVCAIMGGVFGP